MEILKQWAFSVSCIMVLGAVCEMVLPNGNFQKYVRLFIGILMVAALLSPLGKVKQIDMDVNQQLLSEKSERERETADKLTQDNIFEMYISHLNGTVSETLKQSLPDMPIEVLCQVEKENENTYGSITSVLVSVGKPYDDKIRDIILHQLDTQFHIDESQVTIRYRKEPG